MLPFPHSSKCNWRGLTKGDGHLALPRKAAEELKVLGASPLLLELILPRHWCLPIIRGPPSRGITIANTSDEGMLGAANSVQPAVHRRQGAVLHCPGGDQWQNCRRRPFHEGL